MGFYVCVCGWNIQIMSAGEGGIADMCTGKRNTDSPDLVIHFPSLLQMRFHVLTAWQLADLCYNICSCFQEIIWTCFLEREREREREREEERDFLHDAWQRRTLKMGNPFIHSAILLSPELIINLMQFCQFLLSLILFREQDEVPTDHGCCSSSSGFVGTGSGWEHGVAIKSWAMMRMREASVICPHSTAYQHCWYLAQVLRHSVTDQISSV